MRVVCSLSAHRLPSRGALRAPPTFRPDWTNLPLGQSWTARIFANGRLLEEETHTVVAMSHVGGGLYEPLFTARRTPGLHGVYDGGTLLFPTQATAVTFRVTVTGSLCTSGALGPVEVVAGAPAEIQ